VKDANATHARALSRSRPSGPYASEKRLETAPRHCLPTRLEKALLVRLPYGETKSKLAEAFEHFDIEAAASSAKVAMPDVKLAGGRKLVAPLVEALAFASVAHTRGG
jgi:hypothetical protein